MAQNTASPQHTCSFVVGDDGLATWSDTHRDAWIGLLETHKGLLRLLNDDLEHRYGLGVSALELLGRLGAAPDRTLRLTTLADQAGLSLSRVSRLVDGLEERTLVERRLCPGDGRARNAWLTDAGLKLLREAQAEHFAGVQRHFFDHLTPVQIETLAQAFAAFAPGAAAGCVQP